VSAAHKLDRRTLIPVFFVLALWSFGFPALTSYNVTWDEALGDFFFGERYFSYFTSFDARYLDFTTQPYGPERRPDLSISPFKTRPWEYYPVANTLAAATSEILARRLGWLDGFDGFHAFNVLLAAPFIFVLFGFVVQRLGLVAAFATICLLFGAPRIVCDLMANIKDFPSMVFFSLAALAFFVGFERGSWRLLLGAGLLLGLALGTKANALFLPAIPGLLVLLARRPEIWRGRQLGLWAGMIGAGLISVVVMILTWPYLWADPIGRFGRHIEYISGRRAFVALDAIAPTFQAVLLTTPPVFLALLALGLIPVVAAAWRREPLALFLLIWPGVVFGRYLLPQSVNFDGVRHFLEVFPPLAMIAGWGLAFGLSQLGKRLSTPKLIRLKVVFVLLAALPGFWVTLSHHPFQTVYWNSFVGGFAGARDRDLAQASDYWGASYRLGLEWLNKNAPPGAFVVVPVVEHAVRLVAPERLRPDLTLLPVTTPYSPRIAPDRLEKTRRLALGQPVFVMFVERRDWMNEIMVDCLTTLAPEVVWEQGGAPVLAIYRYSPPQGTLQR
jgi:Dolichyl-phosphate-mannose-protein mannosyltransferase